MTRWLYLSIALTVAALAGALYLYFVQYDQLPERIATHWDIHFEPDHWVPKAGVLGHFLVLPGIMAGITLLTLVLPWLSPRSFEVEPFRATYGYVMALVVALMGYLDVVFLWASLKQGAWMYQLLVGGIFLFFALLGNVLGRVRRNFWMGVRTPWTLASEAVWNQTHRVAAWLFVAGGVAGFVAVLIGVPPLWCFVGLIVVALWPVLYSLLLYKRLEKQGRL
jgi:uncharacterized membrane protein